MDLYFSPVLPTETGETCRGEAIYIDVEAPLPLASSKVRVEECEEDEIIDKKRRFFFNSEACGERGNEAERLFLDIAESYGYTQKFTKHKKDFDYFHHVDFMLKQNDQELWVDVKCMRSLRRGWKPQGKYMWVELNTSGWLFGGKSTCIAQQINPSTFLLFDRIELSKFVKNKVEVDLPCVKSAEEAFYRVYLRITEKNNSTRTNALSLIDTAEAFSVCGCGIWKKNV